MDIFFFRKLPRLNSFYPNLTYYRNTKIMLTNCRWWLMSRMTLVMEKWRLNWKWDRRCKKFLFKFLLIMFWNFLVESFGLWKILSKKSPKKRLTAAGKYIYIRSFQKKFKQLLQPWRLNYMILALNESMKIFFGQIHSFSLFHWTCLASLRPSRYTS